MYNNSINTIMFLIRETIKIQSIQTKHILRDTYERNPTLENQPKYKLLEIN